VAGGAGWVWGEDPRQHMLAVSAAGLLASLAVVAPLTVCRPVRFTATGVPLGVLALAAVALLSPAWIVDWIAVPVLLGALVFLYLTGLLIRKGDRRALRRTPLAGLWGGGKRL